MIISSSVVDADALAAHCSVISAESCNITESMGSSILSSSESGKRGASGNTSDLTDGARSNLPTADLVLCAMLKPLKTEGAYSDSFSSIKLSVRSAGIITGPESLERSVMASATGTKNDRSLAIDGAPRDQGFESPPREDGAYVDVESSSNASGVCSPETGTSPNTRSVIFIRCLSWIALSIA